MVYIRMMETVYPEQAPTINYSDVLYAYRFREGEVYRHAMADHSLVYVYADKLTITSGGRTYVLFKGEMRFSCTEFQAENVSKST